MRWLTSLTIISLGVLFMVLFWSIHTPVVLAVTLVFVATDFLLGLLCPRWGIAALLFELPLFNNMIFHERLGYSPPVLVLFLSFFIGWLLHRIWNRDLPRARGPLDTAFLAYALAALGSALITILRYADFYPFKTTHFGDVPVNLLGETSSGAILWVIQTLVIFLSGPAIFWVARHLITSRQELRRVIWALALGLACSVVFGVYQHQGHLALGNTPHFIFFRRINATFIDPNSLGSFYMLSIPVLAGLLVVTRRTAGKVALLAILAGMLYVLALSGSRTGAIGLIVSIVIAAGLLLAHERARRSWSVRKFAGAFAGVLAITVILIILVAGVLILRQQSSAPGKTILSERLEDTFKMIRQDGLIGFLKVDRLWLWQRPVVVTAEYPVVGIGLGAFRTEIPNFLKWDYHLDNFRDNANNFYLQTTSEMGLVGLCLALLVLGMVVGVLLRLPVRQLGGRRETIFLCLLSGSGLSMVVMFITGPHIACAEVGLLFYCLVGAACAQSREAGGGAADGREAVPFALAPGGNRLITVVCILALGVLFAGQSVNAVGSLSHYQRWRKLGLDSSEGFYPWEPGKGGQRIRWTRKEAAIAVPVRLPVLETTLMVPHPDARQNPVRVEVLVNDKVTTTEIFRRPNEARTVRIQLPTTGAEYVKLGFRVDRTFVRGRSSPSSSDMRELGVLVHEFQYYALP